MWNGGRLLLKAGFTQSRQLVVLVPAQGVRCTVHISHQPCPGLGEEARDKAAMGTSVSCSAERHAINRREVMSRSSTVHSYGRPGTTTSTALTFYNTPIN